MKRYLGTMLLLMGAAACSTNKPATGAEDSSQVGTEDPLLAASSSETVEAANASQVGTVGANDGHSSHPHESGSPPASNGSGSGAATPAPAASPDPPASPAPAAASGTAPDNTKVNQRDAGASALTPLDQGNNQTDLKITQQIRQAVMADGSLSFTAKNVKIITVKGKVTLRGPVNSDQERAIIDSAAKKVAGATNVENQLEVKK